MTQQEINYIESAVMEDGAIALLFDHEEDLERGYSMYALRDVSVEELETYLLENNHMEEL